MKRIILLFAVLLAGIIAQAQTPVKRFIKPHAKVAGAKLLLKCNTTATVLVNDAQVGIVEANKLATFSVPAGKSFVSIVPADAGKYFKLDTVISIALNQQDALFINLNEKVLLAKDIVVASLEAMGLNDFGRKFNAIAYTENSEIQLRKCLFIYPDKGLINENKKLNNTQHKNMYNEYIIYNNTAYSRVWYWPFLSKTEQNYLYTNSEYGVADKDRAWDASTDNNPRISMPLRQILDDFFAHYSFFDVNDPANTYEGMGQETISGKSYLKVHLLQTNTSDNGEVHSTYDYLYYFDKETMLPVKVIYKETQNDRFTAQFEYDYSDYKYIAPCMLPAKITATVIRNDFDAAGDKCCGVFTIDNVQINPPLNDKETQISAPTKISSSN